MKDKNDDKTCELALVTTPIKKKRGRTRIHENNAARQKACRARRKEQGFREIKRTVRDVRDRTQPLRSHVLDLSEVRRSRPRSQS